MSDDHTKQERIDYWMNLAQYDLDTAEAMLKTGRLLYVGFMCHQVIEKALKGCYVNRCDKTPPYTHNLAYLCREAGLYDLTSDDQKDFLDRLEPLNIESRYPEYRKSIIDKLSQATCEELIKLTRELHLWLRNQL